MFILRLSLGLGVIPGILYGIIEFLAIATGSHEDLDGAGEIFGWMLFTLFSLVTRLWLRPKFIYWIDLIIGIIGIIGIIIIDAKFQNFYFVINIIYVSSLLSLLYFVLSIIRPRILLNPKTWENLNWNKE